MTGFSDTHSPVTTPNNPVARILERRLSRDAERAP
jgi:hypothetical protein